MMDVVKVCTKCGEAKPLSCYSKQARGLHGKHSQCKVCRQAYRRVWFAKLSPEARRTLFDKQWRWAQDHNKNRQYTLKQYGLTVEDFDFMVLAQGGRCAICGTSNPCAVNRKGWVVDHDHSRSLLVGRRGLLCALCNLMLGRLERGLPIRAEKWRVRVPVMRAYLKMYAPVDAKESVNA